MQARRYGNRPLWLAIGLIALVLPTSASAAIEVGETFDPSAGGNCGAADFTLLQTVAPNDQYIVPTPGVITAWSFQASGSPPLLKLKIGRPAGGNNFTIVGESFLKFPSPNALNTFSDVRIPVEAGDMVGFYMASDGHCGRVSDSHLFHGTTGDIPPGTTTSMTLGSATVQLDVSATLESDCDSDGFGDETQDPTPGCPRTVTLDANKNKVKQGKKVTLSGQLNQLAGQGACEANQTVELQRKRPSNTIFTTFEQLQSDAAGNFSTKEKVKKTFEYRAEVAGTATCAAQVSNTEKVKAKKKKKK